MCIRLMEYDFSLEPVKVSNSEAEVQLDWGQKKCVFGFSCEKKRWVSEIDTEPHFPNFLSILYYFAQISQ